MAVALTEIQFQRCSPPIRDNEAETIGVLVVHECSLFRVGLRSFLTEQDGYRLIGEAIQLADVLTLTRKEHPDIVLLDGSLTSADPLDLVQQLRQLGVQGIMVFAPPAGEEETLFRFLLHGAMAYEDPYISGEELLVKMHRIAQGECLITDDVLVAQTARRERLDRIRQEAKLADACLPAQQGGNGSGSASEDEALLSPQELAILEQIAKGQTNAQVARTLGISEHTVKNRLDQLYQKLSVRDRTSAVVMAIRRQWIAVDGC
jgi:two-component system, NarL family, response regulator LiaR